MTFAFTPQLTQAATLEREPLVTVISGLRMQIGTAVGSAIVICLMELFPDQGIDPGTLNEVYKPKGHSLDDKNKPPANQI